MLAEGDEEVGIGERLADIAWLLSGAYNLQSDERALVV